MTMALPGRHESSCLTPEQASVYVDLRFDRHQPRLRLKQNALGLAAWPPCCAVGCEKTVKRLYSVQFEPGSKSVRYSSQVKPISYLKANAAEVLTTWPKTGSPWSSRRTGKPRPCCRTLRPSRKRRRPWPCCTSGHLG